MALKKKYDNNSAETTTESISKREIDKNQLPIYKKRVRGKILYSGVTRRKGDINS